jgi:acyl carrier protein
MKSTSEKIKNYIAQNILFSGNGYPYSDDASFLENGIVDSMNIMELVMFVEETFHLKVEDREIIPENFDSVEKLSLYVEKKLNTITAKS